MGGAEQVRLSAEKCKRWSFYKEKKIDSVPNTEEVISQSSSTNIKPQFMEDGSVSLLLMQWTINEIFKH